MDGFMELMGDVYKARDEDVSCLSSLIGNQITLLQSAILNGTAHEWGSLLALSNLKERQFASY